NGTQLFRCTSSGTSCSLERNFPANVVAFSMTGIDSNTIWVGLSNNTVERTSSASAGGASTWTSNNVDGAPNLPISAVAVDPSDTQTVYVIYAGFSSINPANRTKHVFRSTDNGTNFVDVS